MRVKFTQGYRGELTKEKHYPPGSVANLPKAAAEKLIEEGRAVLYKKKEVDSA